MFKVKRIYEKAEDSDGKRVLVDRLWPRGLSKEKAKIDLWLKEIAPTDGLRNWYSHEESKWEEFKEKYFSELKDKTELTEQLRELEKKNDVTLLYSAKNERLNNASALKEFLL